MLVMDGIRSRPVGVSLAPPRLERKTKTPKRSEIPAISPGGLAIDGIGRLLNAPENLSGEFFVPVARPRLAFPIMAVSLAAVMAAVAAVVPVYLSDKLIRPLEQTESASVPAQNEAVAAQVGAQSRELQTVLQQFSAAQSVPFGIFVKDLTSGAQASVNESQPFISASLYKLFVAHGIFRLIDQGELSLGSQVRGTNLTVEQCLRVMINVSDNPCGRALGSVLGWSKYDATLHSLGFNSTTLTREQIKTSASDVAVLFNRLYDGTLLAPSSSQRFLTYLKEQKVVNRLPQGLPAGTEIAHKTGDLDGYMHDGGIVYGEKPYIIVALSGPWQTPSSSYSRFADLSAKIFRQFNP